MVASAVFVLDVKGKVLINRNYRGDIPMSAVDKFMPMILDAEDNEVTDQSIQHTFSSQPKSSKCFPDTFEQQ